MSELIVNEFNEFESFPHGVCPYMSTSQTVVVPNSLSHGPAVAVDVKLLRLYTPCLGPKCRAWDHFYSDCGLKTNLSELSAMPKNDKSKQP
jgi:hypothetical protein